MGAFDPKKQVLCRPVLEKSEALRTRAPQVAAAPRAFSRIPTHAIGVVPERRFFARAVLQLPLRLIKVEGVEEPVSLSLLTRNISTSGVYFLSPKKLEIGAAIELEVGLVHRPLGYGNVRMATNARVARIQDVSVPGWYGIGAKFDEIAFDRDEPLPPRYTP